jgi:hypothetical protein
MSSIRVKDRVIYIGDKIDEWENESTHLIVIGIHDRKCAVSDGKSSFWVDSSELRLFKMSDSETYINFIHFINSERKNHKKLYEMHKEHVGPISDSYGSLAANSLTTLSVIKTLFEIFKKEFRQ